MAKQINLDKESINSIKSLHTQTIKLENPREVYLKPLIHKHKRDEAITFEDLETSFEAGKTAVKEYTELVRCFLSNPTMHASCLIERYVFRNHVNSIWRTFSTSTS